MDKERVKSWSCEVDAAFDIIGGKYKAVIIYDLIGKVLRYNEIQKLVPRATPRMLSKQLRELEADGIIERKVYPVVPPKTEYKLTEWGETLVPIMQDLAAWGLKVYEREGVELPY